MDKRVLVFVNDKPIKTTFRNVKSANAYVYALKRNDRNCSIVVVQSDRRINRQNKQARRAFEAQEV